MEADSFVLSEKYSRLDITGSKGIFSPIVIYCFGFFPIVLVLRKNTYITFATKLSSPDSEKLTIYFQEGVSHFTTLVIVSLYTHCYINLIWELWH